LNNPKGIAAIKQAKAARMMRLGDKDLRNLETLPILTISRDFQEVVLAQNTVT
jgi:hypothetical protein